MAGLALAAIGIVNIVHSPGILVAINPWHAVHLRGTVISTPGAGMAPWREHLFVAMRRDARDAADYLRPTTPGFQPIGGGIDVSTVTFLVISLAVHGPKPRQFTRGNDIKSGPGDLVTFEITEIEQPSPSDQILSIHGTDDLAAATAAEKGRTAGITKKVGVCFRRRGKLYSSSAPVR